MKKLVMITFVLSLSQVVTAASLRGKVTDAEGNPLAAASVTYKDGQYVTKTNVNGLFAVSKRSRVAKDKVE